MGRAGAQPGSPRIQQVGVNMASCPAAPLEGEPISALPQFCGHGWGICLEEPEAGYPPSVQPQRAGSGPAAGRAPASTLGLGEVGPVWGVAKPVSR